MKLSELQQLPMDKASRLSRAKAMGFDTSRVWYHGSKVGGFKKFDLKYAGSGVVGTNTSGGFYFSSDEEAAKYYSDVEHAEREDDEDWSYDDIAVYGEAEYYFLVGEINKGPFDSEEEAEDAARELVDKHNASSKGDVIHHDEKIGAYYLALENPLVVKSMDDFRLAERVAKSKGYDGIIGLDIHDGDMYSDVAVVFDPAKIRSINAKFDTSKKGSDKLMAGE